MTFLREDDFSDVFAGVVLASYLYLVFLLVKQRYLE